MTKFIRPKILMYIAIGITYFQLICGYELQAIWGILVLILFCLLAFTDIEFIK